MFKVKVWRQLNAFKHQMAQDALRSQEFDSSVIVAPIITVGVLHLRLVLICNPLC